MAFFISYSVADGEEFALRLADALEAGPPPYSTWLDQRELRPGEDWDAQIPEALKICRGLLFVMTNDSVTDESNCKLELARGLAYKKPIIPLRVDPDAELPFRLGSRQYLNFDNFSAGLAGLRRHLIWMDSPEGLLVELKVRLADARRQLPRTSEDRRPVVESEIQELQRQVDQQQLRVDDPKAEQEKTRDRISAAITREQQPSRPEPEAPARARFVNPPPVTAPGYFQDRHVETGLIADHLNTPGVRIITVVGRGGVGKTAMVCRLLKALEAGRLPDDIPNPTGLGGGDATEASTNGFPVSGIVYLSPTGGHPVSFPNLFADLCRLLPSDIAAPLTERYKDPHETPTALMLALLEAFPTGCQVVLLDNFEDHVDAAGEIIDPALDEALRALLTAPAHGVKIVITTRVSPRALLLVQPGSQRRRDLDDGLASPYAENVLRATDPDGSLGLSTASPELLDTARERTRGYPRALEALAAILAADRDATLPELLAETAQLPGNVVEALVGEAYNRLDPLAQQVMQALAIYPSPVPPVAVDYLLQPYGAAIDSAPVLTRLVNMQFARRDSGRYYLHQVDRDYAINRLPQGSSDDLYPSLAWDVDVYPIDAEDAAISDWPPFTLRALQHRGADYYAQTRTPKASWKTLDDLAPQLAEYELRCEAGAYDIAATVLLDIDFDYLIVWGHYRYTIELHQRLQGHLTDPYIQSGALSNLGACFLRLGNIPRAIDHYQQGLVISREAGTQQAVAACTAGLASCYYMQDDYARAVDHYQQALKISRDVGDELGESSFLAGLADCRLAVGDYPGALDTYQQALTISREIGDRQGEAGNLSGLASCHGALSDYPKAIDHYQQALTITRDIGDRHGEAINLTGLAGCHAAQSDYPKALDHFQQALTIARDTGNRYGEASNLNGIATCYYSQDEYQRAAHDYEAALAIAREIGDRQGEAGNLTGLGGCHAALSDYPKALDHYQRALAITREIGDRQGEANNLGGLASCHAAQSNYPKALDHYEEALAITRDLGDRYGEAINLTGLASCHAAQSNYAKALDHYQQGLAITREIGDRQGEANTLTGLASSYYSQDEYQRAIHDYEQALAMTREIGDRQGEANNLTGLADCHSGLNNYPKAIDHYQQGLAITRDIGDRQGEANNLAGLADCHSALGDHLGAVNYYQDALGISRDVGNRHDEARSLFGLGLCHADQGQTAEGLEKFHLALSIYSEVGDRIGEALTLDSLGTVHADKQEWETSAETCQRAAQIADEIGSPQLQSDTRLTLATTELLAGDLVAADATARAALDYNHLPDQAWLYLVVGVIKLRQATHAEAKEALTSASAAADAQLRLTERAYGALDTKALSLCALTLVGEENHTATAITLFGAARSITSAPGVVARNLLLLDALALADPEGLLAPVRAAAAGG